MLITSAGRRRAFALAAAADADARFNYFFSVSASGGMLGKIQHWHDKDIPYRSLPVFEV